MLRHLRAEVCVFYLFSKCRVSISDMPLTAIGADAVENRLDKAPASPVGASFHGKRQ